MPHGIAPTKDASTQMTCSEQAAVAVIVKQVRSATTTHAHSGAAREHGLHVR